MLIVILFSGHEKTGNEAGIVHSLTALGNSHSRRGAPHLIRYVNLSQFLFI